MIRRILDYLNGKPPVNRSEHWPIVEHGQIQRHPACECCDGKKQLNAHHKLPYHLFPELELADGTGRYCQVLGPDGKFLNNLKTLCNAKRCHILLGHCNDFKAYNPNCDADVEKARQMIQSRKYTR